MSSFNEFLDNVERGRLGLNEGISINIPNLDNDLSILSATYYLLGAESSTGKTSLVDTMILNALDNVALGRTKKSLKVFYFSFEIDEGRKIAKWCAMYIWKKYGIITSYKDILGRSKNRLSDSLFDKVIESRKYFEEIIGKNIIFYDSILPPTSIYTKVRDYCLKVGTIKETTKTYPNNPIIYTSKKYIPNDPDEIVLSVKDHIGYIKKENNMKDTKEAIDRNSKYNVLLRNSFGVSSMDICQFNRSLADVQRQKFKELMPQPNDFKDSGGMYEDCDTAIGIFNPMKHGIKKYADYDIIKYGKRLRFVNIMKNRDGEDNTRSALNFLGEAGFYRNMPRPDQLATTPMYQEKAVKFLK